MKDKKGIATYIPTAHNLRHTGQAYRILAKQERCASSRCGYHEQNVYIKVITGISKFTEFWENDDVEVDAYALDSCYIIISAGQLCSNTKRLNAQCLNAFLARIVERDPSIPRN